MLIYCVHYPKIDFLQKHILNLTYFKKHFGQRFIIILKNTCIKLKNTTRKLITNLSPKPHHLQPSTPVHHFHHWTTNISTNNNKWKNASKMLVLVSSCLLHIFFALQPLFLIYPLHVTLVQFLRRLLLLCLLGKCRAFRSVGVEARVGACLKSLWLTVVHSPLDHANRHFGSWADVCPGRRAWVRFTLEIETGVVVRTAGVVQFIWAQPRRATGRSDRSQSVSGNCFRGWESAWHQTLRSWTPSDPQETEH